MKDNCLKNNCLKDNCLIGIDRPLRPEWIYDTLKLVQVGQKPTVYNEPFEIIAKELIGKESKRKVRTIVFRSFIYSLQESKTTIEANAFIDWVQTDPLRHIAPLFLMKILMDYQITRFVIQKMMITIDSSNQLSAPLLFKYMVKSFGDRDVVKRALNSFLTTLIHFDVLHKVDQNNYLLKEKQALTLDQVKKFILLYAKAFIGSKVIDLNRIEPEFFYFFQPIDLTAAAIEFNGSCWEYIREIERNILILRG